MGDAALSEKTYAMGARVPAAEEQDNTASPTTGSKLKLPTHVLFERDSATTTSSGPDCSGAAASTALCEKPVGPSATNIAIGIGVAIGVVAICVLIYLHRRNMGRLRLEDMNDPHKSLDFGMLETGRGRNGSKRKSIMGLEKDPNTRRRQQLSMDMNLSSPYLLPPELHNSRESMNSLARTLHQNEDPYRPTSQHTDAPSIRKGRESSVYSGNNLGRDGPRSPTWDPANGSMPPSRQNSVPSKSAIMAPEAVHVKAQQGIIEEVSPTPPPPAYTEPERFEEEPIPQILSVPQPPNRGLPALPAIHEPGLARKPQLGHADSAVDMAQHDFNFGIDQEQHNDSLHGANALGLMGSEAAPPAMTAPVIEEPKESRNEFAQMPTMPQEAQFEKEEWARGQRASRMPGGLGVPTQDNRRLSVGFRPLPPEDIMESDDPEYRANRIRSFYKEYFDDSKPTEPVPPLPSNNVAINYYEDYSEPYGEAAYFDPETNAFVMPYAQPVARRAMTPPPSGQRFAGGGPRGPPHQYHGSMGMGMPGMRGPPRPDSSASNRVRQGPPGPRPRAGSAMSGRMGGPRRPPLPPPADLTTLPTPSKLRDDSFAIFNAADFAPPTTFAERARGRSQSPVGERKAYKVNVPAVSPLVNAFDELSALPSPHLLRKSGAFTALDFAPPRKFANEDGNHSETGSIRSNRSGISAAQLGAIRNGAGRVSRLPGDTVFTQASLQDQLKPQWGMRP